MPIHTMMFRSTRRSGKHRTITFGVAATLLVLGAAPSTVSATTPKPPAVDAPNASAGNYGWFEGGKTWTGEFADPTVVLYKGVYYAYSSGAGGRYLGVQTSTDLVHWRVLDHWSDHAPPWLGGPDLYSDTTIPAEMRASGQSAVDIYNLNDAIARPAAWGVRMNYNAWYRRDYWAVGVGQIATTWYTWAPVKVSNQLGDGTWDPEGFGRYCLTKATGRSPIGPFRDVTGSKPWYCDVDPGGSIDPAHYRDPATGRHYLTWKAAGRRSRPGVTGYPTALKAVRLDSSGNMTGPIVTLLTTNEGTWEGSSIENPAMQRYQGHWYLFYSGNSFLPDASGHSKYATGYALRDGPLGPCRRISSQPLMSQTAIKTGMGGASAFVDLNGKLRLVAASYWPGEYRTYPIHQPRRMFVVTITRRSDNTLYRGG